MNDFFTDGNAPKETRSPEEQQAERDKIQAEVFDGTPAKFDDVKEETKDETSQDEATSPEEKTNTEDEVVSTEDIDKTVEDVDPADETPKLPPEMQAIVDSINNLTTNISGMEDRIKQTERRIGGISNEFYAAKEAAATQVKAPTPEEMKVAAKEEETWKELKRDFPLWADVLESKITAQASNYVSVADFEALRKSLEKAPEVDPQQLETRLVGLIHPDHEQITQDPAYASWLTSQSEAMQHKAYKGTTAEEAIDVFNQYKARKVKPVTETKLTSEVKQIKEQRKKQLESSTITNTKHKIIKAKAEADMNEAELREHIAAKVFAKS